MAFLHDLMRRAGLRKVGDSDARISSEGPPGSRKSQPSQPVSMAADLSDEEDIDDEPLEGLQGFENVLVGWATLCALNRLKCH